MPVIEVKNLTKEYHLGTLQSLRQAALNAAARMAGKPVPERPLFKALDNVSFSIERGEVVGIIGHNGAGKSTLLKMLAKISSPTHGEIRVNGRVAPLIEVGAGFVPDLTGRENVYLNGSILGMSRSEIDEKFDEIVEFAEMEKFIDTPVKRYSSGMQVKLAFSVATSIDAEILIVDEVLAVGDIAFQQKCIERMEKLIWGEGRTVLIVGHNIRQLQRICNRVIQLDHGRVSRDGEPAEVCAAFYDEAQSRNIARHVTTGEEVEPQQSTNIIRVRRIVTSDRSDNPTNKIGLHEPLKLCVDFECNRKIEHTEIVVGLHTSDFVHVLSVGNSMYDACPDFDAGAHNFTCELSDIPLRPGAYALRLAFLDKYRQTLWYAENITPIVVTGGRFDITKIPALGLVDVPASWHFPAGNNNPPNEIAPNHLATTTPECVGMQ